jgi:hypothetical protein
LPRGFDDCLEYGKALPGVVRHTTSVARPAAEITLSATSSGSIAVL